MPAVAPPFPVARKPHLDLEIRELYRRVGAIERVLRTSAPSPAPTSVTVKTVDGKTLYCVRGRVRYDQGWGNFGKLWGGYALYLLKLYPPSMVLSVSAYLSRKFESDEGDEQSFGGLVLVDLEPHEVSDPNDPGPPAFRGNWRYWGAELNPDGLYPWVSMPIAIDLKVQHPSLASYRYNIRRYQRRAREGSGRQDIDPLPYLPFTCGWTFGGTPAATASEGVDWSEGMRGEVTVVAVWIDDLVNREVSGVSFRAQSLFAVKPLKVGPR